MSDVKKKKVFWETFKEICADDFRIAKNVFLIIISIIIFILSSYWIGRFVIHINLWNTYEVDINDIVQVFALGLLYLTIISPLMAVAVFGIMFFYGMINKIIAINRYCYIPLTVEEIQNINNNAKNKNKINNINDYIKYINKATHYYFLGHDYINLNNDDYFKFLEVSYKLWPNEMIGKNINLIYKEFGAFPHNSLHLSSELKPWISEKYGLIFIDDIIVPIAIYNQGSVKLCSSILWDFYDKYGVRDLDDLIDNLSIEEIRTIIEECINRGDKS